MNKILDLGCGDHKLAYKNKFPGYDFNGEVIGLDLENGDQVDVIWNLEKGKMPFKEGSFDIVYTHHVLEHLENESIINVLRDVHRILKKGGHFLICVPHIAYLDSLGSLNHKKLFSNSSLDFMIEGEKTQFQCKEKFKLVKKKMIFGKVYRAMGVQFFANRFPHIYNEFLMGIFPAREMRWELEK